MHFKNVSLHFHQSGLGQHLQYLVPLSIILAHNDFRKYRFGVKEELTSDLVPQGEELIILKFVKILDVEDSFEQLGLWSYWRNHADASEKLEYLEVFLEVRLHFFSEINVV